MHTHLFTKCIIDNIYINYILRNNTKKKKKKKKKRTKEIMIEFWKIFIIIKEWINIYRHWFMTCECFVLFLLRRKSIYVYIIKYS